MLPDNPFHTKFHSRVHCGTYFGNLLEQQSKKLYW